MTRFYNSLWPRRLARSLGLIAAAFCLWQAGGSFKPSKEVRATVGTTSRETLKTVPIATLRVGQRVLATNPEMSGTKLPDSDITPRDWRAVRLVMEKPNGGQIDIELLRPVDWLLACGLRGIDEHPEYLLPRPIVAASAERSLCELLLGRTISLDLPEMGASGLAVVTGLGPCPLINPEQHGDRRIVTGTFHHSAGNVINLQIEGEPQSIGVTDNHPFWSEDRNTFVPAGKLQRAERLRRADDTIVRVASITPRDGPPLPVYNLEVDAEHVYFVGQNGVLVHNTYKTQAIVIGENMELVKAAARELRDQGINATWYRSWTKNWTPGLQPGDPRYTMNMANNMRWIRNRLDQGFGFEDTKQLYSIGIDPSRPTRSEFFFNELLEATKSGATILTP